MLEPARQPVFDDTAFETQSNQRIKRTRRTKRTTLTSGTGRSTRKRTTTKKSPNPKLRVLAAIVTIFVFGVYYTSLSAAIAGKSYELEQLQQEIAQMETSNARMELTLNSMSSLNKVETIAIKELGMEKRATDVAALVASADAVESAAAVDAGDGVNAAEGEQPSGDMAGQEESKLAFADLVQAFKEFFSPGSAQASNN